MIKVQNNIATREPLPEFLVGLAVESLADLSWTDPQLGVSNAAWWPEVDQCPELGQFQVYGDETLTPDAQSKTVICVKAVLPMPQDKVDAINSELAAEVKAKRAEAYRTESDPLFFKAQRGEATQQQWLDKVAEIKARYPA